MLAPTIALTASLIFSIAGSSLPAATVIAQPAAPAAQAAETWTDPTNAALIYYKQWIGENPEEKEKIAEAWGNGLDKPVTEEAKKILQGHQGEIGAFIRAGKMTNCDFGIEWSHGFGALLPHLAKCRNTARWLGLDAARLVQEGKQEEAAERVAAIYNLAAHVGNDRILISSLVSIAICSVGDRTAAMVMDSARLTVPTRDLLLAAARRVRQSEFGVPGAIRGERAMAQMWLSTQFDGPDAGAKFLRSDGAVLLDNSGENAARQAPVRKQIQAMDGAMFKADLARMAPYYDALLGVWDRPDAEDQIKALEQRLQKGEFGQFAMILAPSFDKAHVSHVKARKNLDEVINRLMAM